MATALAAARRVNICAVGIIAGVRDKIGIVRLTVNQNVVWFDSGSIDSTSESGDSSGSALVFATRFRAPAQSGLASDVRPLLSRQVGFRAQLNRPRIDQKAS
jgi:hypothetical protein